MGWFKKVRDRIKKIAEGISDVALAVSYVVAAPVNSVTGNKYSPPYRTNAGATFGRIIENSVDNQHTLFKSFADTLLFGLPTKLANTIRADKNKESVGRYLENTKDYKNKILNKLNNVSGYLGTLVASKVGGSETTPASSNDGGKVETVDFIGIAKTVGVIALIVFVLSRIFK